MNIKNIDISTFVSYSAIVDLNLFEAIHDVLSAEVWYGRHLLQQAMIAGRMLSILPESECQKARAAGFMAIEEHEWKARLEKAKAYEDANGASIYDPDVTDYEVGVSQGKLEIVKAVLVYRGKTANGFLDDNVIDLAKATSLSDIASFEDGILANDYDYGVQIGRLIAMGCILRGKLEELLS